MRQRRREPHWSLTTLATETNPGPDGHGSNTGITLSELDNIWNRIRSDLRGAVSDSTFQVWIDPLKPALLEDGVLVVEAPDSIRRWVESRFGDVLQRTAESVRGTATRVELTAPGRVRPLGHADPHGEAESGLSAGESNPTLSLNPKLCFDQFVIGQGNRLAHASALAVAEMPSQTYNPLFIYGPPGTGKTHLLHAIGNLARQHTPGLKVAFTNAEDFTNRFVDSIRRGEMPAFKERFRDVDLLLLDDAQFLASKTRTEEEFFHTFNQVVDSGAQVVVTCDRTPGDLDALEQRLRDRFASGLVADIAPPDMPSRMAILAMRARRDSLGEVPVEAMEAIAERVKGNVRMLEGALIRVVAYGSLTGSRLSRDLAGQVLDQLYPGRTGTEEPRPGPREIKLMVAETFGVSINELDSRSRSARIVWPRQVAMYLSREVAGEPLPQIGMAFGGRNHSTVLNACKRVRERVSADPKAALTVRSLERRIVDGDDRIQ